MPAAAVIPAPLVYVKVVAVKKLVVGFLVYIAWPGMIKILCAGLGAAVASFVFCLPLSGGVCGPYLCDAVLPCCVSILQKNRSTLHWAGPWTLIVYFEKIRVFKAGIVAVNILAWNNKIGLWPRWSL